MRSKSGSHRTQREEDDFLARAGALSALHRSGPSDEKGPERMSHDTEPQVTSATRYPLRVQAIEAYDRALREGFDASRNGRTVKVHPTTAEAKARRRAAAAFDEATGEGRR